MGSEPAAPTEHETTHRATAGGRMLLAIPRFRLFLAVTVAWFLSFFLLQAALPKYLERHHFSNGQIGLVIGILSVSAVLSRPYLGRAMDRGLLFPLLVASCLMMLS